MRIAAAQIPAFKGDLDRNIAAHVAFIETAAKHHVNWIIFPELSLTGYEPDLARQLAIFTDDRRLEPFQPLSERHRISIAVGVPLQGIAGVEIAMLLFQPGKPKVAYSKYFLHEDELPFFKPGKQPGCVIADERKLGFAICYEISVAEHAFATIQKGAEVYVASVAKTSDGVQKARERLEQVAIDFNIPVLMCNAVGEADGMVCGGGSFAISPTGGVIAQLDRSNEGLLLMDVSVDGIRAETIGNKQ